MKRYKPYKFDEMSSYFNNTVFYNIFKSNPDIVYLSGDTFDIKEIIKKQGAKWDSLEKKWAINIDKIKPLFDSIIELGYSITPEKGIDKSLIIKDFEDEYNLIIPKGINGKNNIKIKSYSHYAPMTQISGNGTKYIKPLLLQYHFKYDTQYFIWNRVELSDIEFKEFTTILKDNNYNIELLGISDEIPDQAQKNFEKIMKIKFPHPINMNKPVVWLKLYEEKEPNTWYSILGIHKDFYEVDIEKDYIEFIPYKGATKIKNKLEKFKYNEVIDFMKNTHHQTLNIEVVIERNNIKYKYSYRPSQSGELNFI